MIGYTRKVGLRKPGDAEFFEAVRLAKRRLALMDTIRKAAATLDGLPPEMRETLAHRTALRSVPYDQGGLLGPISRTFNAYATPEPVDPATCPHCCCTSTTECCYCDGSRTPLEDS